MKSRKERGGFPKYLAMVLEELKRGLEPRKLDDRNNKNGIPHDTLYRIIRLLKDSGIIYKGDDGKYYYTWRRGIREFSKENYEIALNHSKQFLIDSVVKGSEIRLSELMKDSPRERIYEKIKVEKLIENKYFIQHLESGYPEIYELYKEWKSLEKSDEKENVYSSLKEKIEFLIKKILHGEPLDGRCDLCPWVIVREVTKK